LRHRRSVGHISLYLSLCLSLSLNEGLTGTLTISDCLSACVLMAVRASNYQFRVGVRGCGLLQAALVVIAANQKAESQRKKKERDPTT